MTLKEREIYRRAVEKLASEKLQAAYDHQPDPVKKTIIEIEAVRRRFRLRKEKQ